MRKHGYGVVVMCHALPALTRHVENEAHDARVFLFLNWRQCRTKMKNYIISHMSKLHDTTYALRDNCLAAPPREHAETSLEQSDDKNTTSTAQTACKWHRQFRGVLCGSKRCSFLSENPCIKRSIYSKIWAENLCFLIFH